MATKSTLMQKKKGDLVNIILTLKEELMKNKETIEQRKSLEKKLSEVGLGVIKEDGVYKLAIIKYNGKSRQSTVEELVELGRDYSIALLKAKQFLVEDILGKL